MSAAAPLAMAVACGEMRTVMVAEEGRAVLACGRGSRGQLGNGTREHQRVLGQVSGLEGARVVMVAAGGNHTAASTSEGELLTWGSGSDGQLGHGDRAVRTRPAKLGREVFGGSSVILVSCGGFHTMGGHTMVETEVGRLFTFGFGNFGQLGHGDRNDRDVPAERFRGARVVFAAAGGLHSGVVTSEGRVFTWGWGLYGKLGHGDEHDQLVPSRGRLRESSEGARPSCWQPGIITRWW